jgi:hypothetical protein
MLIVCSKEGQLCNRLYHFSHIASFAKENNELLWYPYINEYSKFFNILQTDELKKNKIIIYSNPLLKIVLKVIRWLLIRIPNTKLMIFNDSENEINLNLYKGDTRRIIFISGWLIRDNVSFEKNTKFIKNILKFNDNIVQKSIEKITNIKNSNTLLIGVHVRRGDYESFQGGKFFYDANTYKDKMQQLKNLFSNEKKNIHFLISTNDINFLIKNMIYGHDITLNNGSEESDLYCLSQCDLIIGPPSTFSAWASYYGSVPLLYITHESQIIQKSDFKLMKY